MIFWYNIPIRGDINVDVFYVCHMNPQLISIVFWLISLIHIVAEKILKMDLGPEALV